jgi:hypothetical protein
MQSVGEHQEVPKDEAAVMPVGGLRKRRRDRNLAAERRQKPKELTRGDCRSRRKLAAACRKMSRRAAVAWRKRNIFRKIRPQGNCGPRKELAAAGRSMTHSATVARRRGHDRKRYDQDIVTEEIRKGRTEQNRRRKSPECNNGIRDRGLRQQTNKGPRRQTDALSEEGEDNHERHRRVEFRTEIAHGKRRNAQEDPI